MFNNKKNASETPKSGLKIQINHRVIDTEQMETFTEMVKTSVKILVVGSIVAVAAGFALKTGSEIISYNVTNPN